jgi:hypothetical protein
LRPENIRLRADAREARTSQGVTEAALDDTVRFRAAIRHQIFGGATDLVEVACPDGQVLLARLPSRGHLQGEHEFEFSAVDAVRVRDEV